MVKIILFFHKSNFFEDREQGRPCEKMDVEHKMDRVAIVNKDKCKPKKCGLECKKICPVNMSGKECIDVSKISAISKISEELCIGCGQCVRVCPYKAITIVNLPKGLHKDLVHQYGPNSFRLHRLPVIKPGQILGLVGSNGTGKSSGKFLFVYT